MKTKKKKTRGGLMQGRRIRKGRVAMALAILAGIILIPVVCVRSCNSDAAPAIIRQESREAYEAGRRDATRVLDTHPESMERHQILLEIQERRWKMISNGYKTAADDYQRGVSEILTANGIL